MPVTQDTPSLPAAVVERSLRLNIAAGLLGMAWMSVALGMPLPLLMQAIGASGFQLGLLAASWQLATLAQIPSALLVERLRWRKGFWAGISIAHRVLWGVPVLLPIGLPDRIGWWPPIIIGSLALSNVLGQGGTALWQSWMADLVPASRAGRFWGVRHRILSAGLIVVSIAGGVALDAFTTAAHPWLGFQIVFGAASVLGIGDIVLHCTVAEPRPAHGATHLPVLARVLAPLHDRDLRLLTLAMGAWAGAQAIIGYTLGLPGFFSIVYLKETFGASYSQASWVFIASAVSAVIWTPLVGHWVDRTGARRVAMTLVIVGPCLSLAWLFVRPGEWMAIPQPVLLLSSVGLLSGGAYAGMLICQYRLTQNCTAPEGRTLAMAVHWSVVGFLGALGPLLAGWVKDVFPIPPDDGRFGYFQVLVLLHVALAWGVVVPLLGRMKVRERAEG